jgi:hypothetical protein
LDAFHFLRLALSLLVMPLVCTALGFALLCKLSSVAVVWRRAWLLSALVTLVYVALLFAGLVEEGGLWAFAAWALMSAAGSSYLLLKKPQNG